MTDHSTIVREVALNCEAKKHAYRQTQDGVVVSFVLHPQEVPDGLATAPLGTRYVLAMVELNDDETPKGRRLVPIVERPASDTEERPARAVWDDMTPTAQAHTYCSDSEFWEFAKVNSKEAAHSAVLWRCGGIKSFAEILPGTMAARHWLMLVGEFRAYRRAKVA